MDNETSASMPDWKDKKWRCGGHGHGAMGGAYGLAFLGAAVYYIQNSQTFWMGVVGVLKALVWPAFLIYEMLKFLKM